MTTDIGAQKAAPPRWIRRMPIEPLCSERVAIAKKAFTTRRVPFGSADYNWDDVTLISGPVRPRSGDIVLATVERIGHHSRIELTDGRRSNMHLGDEIIVTYADRYAPDQFESEVPKNLGPTHLVASGGVASTVLTRHGSTRRPTDITPVGLIGNRSGTPLNIAEFSIRPDEPTGPRPRTVAVIGTSMNSGKTTAVSSLILGLKRGGRKPGGTKVTGTGSGHDYWIMIDAGAHCVADFTDTGLASTYRVPYDIVEANFIRLIEYLTNAGSSDIIIEIADGVYQPETARLIRSEVFRAYVDQVVFTAGDSIGAVAGVKHLQDLKLPVIGASGMFTRSELSMNEAAANMDVPVWSREDLSSPLAGPTVLESIPLANVHQFGPQPVGPSQNGNGAVVGISP